ncbi:MFS transporter [Massilia endophytica]|uniref:MFS transporter n=1 Tax=Massilia endophytica TaxID=2899220 RepID=UPI001E30212A|nr:MFS transporter [Massilia endophytica]UGQ48038.1 MFS transporter [Massilia endophytica]
MSAPDGKAALRANPNFRWLMRGGLLSMLGDQFTLIALPWLVLKLTGDPLSLGLVIALMSIPRAIFILIGGALVDRYSPMSVLMLSKYASAVLLGLLAALTFSGLATLPLVYPFAFAIGLSQAFAIPSATSMAPRALPPELLQASNSMMMGMRQLTVLAGPLLAALMIALAGGGDSVQDMRALGLAFAVDCLSFIVSAWTLSNVHPLPAPPRGEEKDVLRAVGEGIAMVWGDTALRTCFLYWGLVAFFIGGATQVALPVLAKDTLHSATAFGILLGAHGAGTLFGMAASAMGRKLTLPFGAMLLLGDAFVGLVLIPLGMIETTWQGVLLLLAMGLVGGFMQIAVFTWIQTRVPPQMLGRAMSLFMFIFMGLAPLSAAATGWILQHTTLAGLFAGSGAVLVLFAALAWLFTPMRRIQAG